MWWATATPRLIIYARFIGIPHGRPLSVLYALTARARRPSSTKPFRINRLYLSCRAALLFRVAQKYRERAEDGSKKYRRFNYFRLDQARAWTTSVITTYRKYRWWLQILWMNRIAGKIISYSQKLFGIFFLCTFMYYIYVTKNLKKAVENYFKEQLSIKCRKSNSNNIHRFYIKNISSR